MTWSLVCNGEFKSNSPESKRDRDGADKAINNRKFDSLQSNQVKQNSNFIEFSCEVDYTDAQIQ